MTLRVWHFSKDRGQDDVKPRQITKTKVKLTSTVTREGWVTNAIRAGGFWQDDEFVPWASVTGIESDEA